MKRIAPWNVVHKCDQCENGWVCENHPNKPWPSGCDCGAGMPCSGLLADTARYENAVARGIIGCQMPALGVRIENP